VLVLGVFVGTGVVQSAAAIAASAEQQPPPVIPGLPPATAATTAAVNGPRVNPDRTITFRLFGPQASLVELDFLTPGSKPIAMRKGNDGFWTVTVGPQAPDIYIYHFIVDGVCTIDLHNGDIDIGRAQAANVIEVPGASPRFDESMYVSEASIHIRDYISKVLGLRRRLYVWVPPEYDAEPNRRFPVLYLRHGNGATEMNWSAMGRAGVIAENLIRAGRAVPMIIVMPNGYPSTTGAGSSPEGITATTAELLHDIVPFVDRRYRTLSRADQRAIAGLSMGGGQAFVSGLRNPETFAWVGAFSSGVISDPRFDFKKAVPGFLESPSLSNQKVHLLFLSCGTEDPRLKGYEQLVDTLKAAGVAHQYFTTPGDHEFKVWRRSLAEFLPRLFKP
jgi:enterochelin esterase family protein